MPEFLVITIVGLVVLAAMIGTGYFVQPANGFAIKTSESRNIFIDSNVELTSYSEKILELNGKVENNVLNNKKLGISFDSKKYDRMILEFNVYNKNNVGKLIIKVNDIEVYNNIPDTIRNEIEVNPDILLRKNNIIVFEAQRDLWRILSNNFYDTKFKLYGLIGEIYEKNFVLKENDYKLRIYFRYSNGKLKIKLNGDEVFFGNPEDYVDFKFKGKEKNKLEIIPEMDSSFLIDWIGVI